MQVIRAFASFQRIHPPLLQSHFRVRTSTQKRMASLLNGIKIVLPDGSLVDGGEHLKGKVVALYFSAGWCPPCRAFTPKLKAFYEKLQAAGKNFEVVWVSRDRSEEDLLEYYRDHHAKWTYLPYGDAHIQEYLEKFGVKTIPALKVVKPDGTVVVQDARTEVAQKGENATDLFEEWLAFYN